MFDTHLLNDDGLKAMKEFKTKMSITCSEVMEVMSDPRAKAIFKTKVEEAVFFGAKAIAEDEKFHKEKISYPEFDGTNGIKL